MQQPLKQKDTAAWIFQVWASFIISMGAMGASIFYLPSDRPIDNWMKWQLTTTFLFTVSSTFTLAKTVRDNHEAVKTMARIDEARVEKILSEHHPLK